MNKPTLLICTVGGSPEPIAATLRHWQPQRVKFVHTPGTKGKVDEVIQMTPRDVVDIDSGRYDMLELADEQDFTSCIEGLRELTDDVHKWAAREGHQVVVDLTGGTKCMSAALAILASRWPCLFSYVGGKERTKDGVGTVVSGSEVVHHELNPWDALGQRAVEDYLVLFDKHAYRSAASVAERTKKNVSRTDRKEEFAVLENLAKALYEWDCFNHQGSIMLLKTVSKSANNLRAALGDKKGNSTIEGVRRLEKHLDGLVKAASPSRYHVVDLLANARRRKEEGRLDDSVARLYRAVEAIAQVALKESHGVESTEKVPLEVIPESLRTEYMPRADENRALKLGLQDSYRLLDALGDPIGSKFKDAGLGDRESALSSRNQSILAHGFQSVGNKVADQLWVAALRLAGVDESDLPYFPRIAGGD